MVRIYVYVFKVSFSLMAYLYFLQHLAIIQDISGYKE